MPKISNQFKDNPYRTVSINSDLGYFIETTPVSFDRLEETLVAKLTGTEDPTVSLHCDKSVPIEEVVKVMNIAMKNKFKLILATRPE